MSKHHPTKASEYASLGFGDQEVLSVVRNDGTESVGAHAAMPEEKPSGGRRSRESNSQREEPTPHREGQDKPRKGFLRRHPNLALISLVLAVAIAAAGYVYWDYAEHFESTDDAFIAARQFSVEPEVSGHITAVPVTDNQHVAAGDVIARIDDRHYRIALEQAKAQVASAEAGIQRIDAQLSVQRARIAADQAQLDQLQAALAFAEKEATRYENLAREHAGSVEQAQRYSSQLAQQKAEVQRAQATLMLAKRQVDSLKAQRESAVASLAQAKAQRSQAQLNLSYATVKAAQAGRVVQLSAAVGEFAQVGTSLAMFVPDKIWVTANFKETELDAMRPGQPATIHIDAYPERTIHGHVVSVQPGSGTAFSLLPAENATGNYVKIVQRVPVKIVMDNPPTDVALGPGMSVEPMVRINPSTSLYERLTRWL
jgi:membrane fusion protein (multidrug efflux system)